MTAHHELLQETPSQDRSVTRAIDARSPYVFRGKRNFRRRFLRDVIADHTMKIGVFVNLAKVDLLYYTHAHKRRGLFDIVEIEMTKAKVIACCKVHGILLQDCAEGVIYADAPTGHILKSSGLHCATAWYENVPKSAAWKSIADDIAGGLEKCTDINCDPCTEAMTFDQLADLYGGERLAN